jgi:hypothetical protein
VSLPFAFCVPLWFGPVPCTFRFCLVPFVFLCGPGFGFFVRDFV